MNPTTIERLQAKTPQQRFIRVLEHEFHFAPKIAQAVLEEAHASLLGNPEQIQPGQVRAVFANLTFPYFCGHKRRGRSVVASWMTNISN